MHRESRADLPREMAAGAPVLQATNTEVKFADMRITDLSTIRGMYKGAEHVRLRDLAERQLPAVMTDAAGIRAGTVIPDMTDLSTHLRIWVALQAVRKSVVRKRRILL